MIRENKLDIAAKLKVVEEAAESLPSVETLGKLAETAAVKKPVLRDHISMKFA